MLCTRLFKFVLGVYFVVVAINGSFPSILLEGIVYIYEDHLHMCSLCSVSLLNLCLFYNGLFGFSKYTTVYK
jgi:predicted membrane protein